MPLDLLPLTKDDALEIAHLIVESYKNNPFRQIIFPNGMGQESIDKLVDGHNIAADDPDKYGLKVVDTDTGKIVASAVWHHTKAFSDKDWEREKAKAMDDFPGASRDILEPIVMNDFDTRRRIMGHQRWWELVSLNTLPKYQRRGIGSMLMKWGTDKLEEMKWPGFIISTDQGYGLYLKHGYEEVDRWEVDLSQWGVDATYKNVFFIRQPTGSATELP